MFAQSIPFDLSDIVAGFEFVGVELVIFLVTLVAACAWRHLDTKRFHAAKLASWEEKLPKVTVSECDVREVEPKVPGVPGSPPHWSIREKNFIQALACDLDDIALHARDPQSTRTVHQVMQMYENLLETLAQRGIALPEVANHARHTSVDVYSSLVYCVVRASRCHLVGRLLDDMIHQGVARPLHFYESTMKQLAGVKRYKQALNVYERLAKDGLQPSPVTLSCLINFAVEVGELRRAINFFTLLASQTTPSIRAYMTVLRVHSMRQDWPSAIGIIYDMKGKGVPVDTLALNVALGTGIVADRLEEVEAVIQEAPQVDIVSYNTLLKGYAQRSDLIKAHQVFQSLLLRDLKPNAITFNTIIDAAVRSCEFNRAWQLLEDMECAGFAPDRFTCSIMVKGITKFGERVDGECSAAQEAYIKNVLKLIRKVATSFDKPFLSQMFHAVFEACGDVPSLAQEVVFEMRQNQVALSSSTQKQLLRAITRMAKK